MAQAPNTSAPSSGGGSKSSGGSGSKGGSKGSARASGKSSSKSNNKGNGRDKLMAQANHVPAHHAHHPMSGEYATKGKFSLWADGREAFK